MLLEPVQPTQINLAHAQKKAGNQPREADVKERRSNSGKAVGEQFDDVDQSESSFTEAKRGQICFEVYQ